MILKYGPYAHEANEAELVVEKTSVFNAAQQRQAVRERWTIQGRLHGDGPASLTAGINALLAAYAVNGRDAGLFLDDGVTPTCHQLRSSLALGGVRVLEVSFPDSRGAEYATYRGYRVILEAEFPAAGVELLSWVETVAFEGGGPRWVLIETRAGPPQRQQVSQATSYRVIQEGSAVGAFAYPFPAPPLWPAAEHRDRRRIRKRLPRRCGPAYTEFEIDWRYEFASAAALAGRPTPWPR